MKKYVLLTLLVAAFLTTVSAQASVVTYNFTATGGHFGSFSYDDTATSIGNGPYSCCASAYNAVSFSVDGSPLATPELVMYDNYSGNQYAYFTTSAGYDAYVQLFVSGTGLFASADANQMDGRMLSDFTPGSNNQLFIGGSVQNFFDLTSLTTGTSSVPEPSAFGMILLASLGVIGFARKSYSRN